MDRYPCKPLPLPVSAFPLQAVHDEAKAAYAAERKKVKTPSKERRASDIHSEALQSLRLLLLAPGWPWHVHGTLAAHLAVLPACQLAHAA